MTTHELVEYLISRGVKVNGSYVNHPHDHGAEIEDDGEWADVANVTPSVIIRPTAHHVLAKTPIHHPDPELIRKFRACRAELVARIAKIKPSDDDSHGFNPMEAW